MKHGNYFKNKQIPYTESLLWILLAGTQQWALEILSRKRNVWDEISDLFFFRIVLWRYFWFSPVNTGSQSVVPSQPSPGSLLELQILRPTPARWVWCPKFEACTGAGRVPRLRSVRRWKKSRAPNSFSGLQRWSQMRNGGRPVLCLPFS